MVWRIQRSARNGFAAIHLEYNTCKQKRPHTAAVELIADALVGLAIRAYSLAFHLVARGFALRSHLGGSHAHALLAVAADGCPALAHHPVILGFLKLGIDPSQRR